jgi:DNA replication licensing factor MCM3
MREDNVEQSQEYEAQISKYMSKTEIRNKIQKMVNDNSKRLVINLDNLRQFDNNLANEVLINPLKLIPIFENNLKEQTDEIYSSTEKLKQRNNEKFNTTKISPFKVTFEGTFGRNMVSPRGLNAELTNQLVCIQGIITRMSIVRPKLVTSVHYSEEMKQGNIKYYYDQYSITNPDIPVKENNSANSGPEYLSNAIPNKDINGNPLTFEYGLSHFRDHQTLLVQEPPERTPVGQLPRSVDVILEDDIVDSAKPGDR